MKKILRFSIITILVYCVSIFVCFSNAGRSSGVVENTEKYDVNIDPMSNIGDDTEGLRSGGDDNGYAVANAIDEHREGPMSPRFFNAIESGRYYLKLGNMFSTSDDVMIELALDGENLEYIVSDGDRLIIRQVVLGNVAYMISDEQKSVEYMVFPTPGERYLFNFDLLLSGLLIFQSSPHTEGISKLESY